MMSLISALSPLTLLGYLTMAGLAIWTTTCRIRTRRRLRDVRAIKGESEHPARQFVAARAQEATRGLEDDYIVQGWIDEAVSRTALPLQIALERALYLGPAVGMMWTLTAIALAAWQVSEGATQASFMGMIGLALHTTLIGLAIAELARWELDGALRELEAHLAAESRAAVEDLRLARTSTRYGARERREARAPETLAT